MEGFWRGRQDRVSGTLADGNVEMLRKIVGQRQPGSEERVWKLRPGAVMGSGCQETCPEDVYISAGGMYVSEKL